MATIEEAIQGQMTGLMNDLLNQNARLLSGLGIDRKWRNYWKSGEQKKLPPIEAVFAALILLGREIQIEGLTINGSNNTRYSIVALQQTAGSQESASPVPFQLSLLADLDFSSGSEATIERAEKIGPGRVELLLSVRQPRVG